MCVLDAADGSLVGLHDGLEVEAHAVPQGELAARRPGQQAAALGRPFDDVDGVLDLVEGGVDGFGGYRLGGVGQAGCRGLHVHDVACARALHLRHAHVLVPRASVAHPLHCGCAIVGHGACGVRVSII